MFVAFIGMHSAHWGGGVHSGYRVHLGLLGYLGGQLAYVVFIRGHSVHLDGA